MLSVPVKRELLVLSTFREGLFLWVSTNLPAIAHTWKSSRSILSSLVDRTLLDRKHMGKHMESLGLCSKRLDLLWVSGSWPNTLTGKAHAVRRYQARRACWTAPGLLLCVLIVDVRNPGDEIGNHPIHRPNDERS